MIARVWHGWAEPSGADAYEEHFRGAVMAELRQVDGYLGCNLLRREGDGEVEFVAVTYFTSLDAVRGFAGEDAERAVVAPEAQQALTRWEEFSTHYEVAARS